MGNADHDEPSPLSTSGVLRAERVPVGVEVLFPLVPRWGASDDVTRSTTIENADEDDLRQLILTVESVDPAALFGWLAWPESQAVHPSREYLAITCLTMAADEARVTLANRA